MRDDLLDHRKLVSFAVHVIVSYSRVTLDHCTLTKAKARSDHHYGDLSKSLQLLQIISVSIFRYFHQSFYSLSFPAFKQSDWMLIFHRVRVSFMKYTD